VINSTLSIRRCLSRLLIIQQAGYAVIDILCVPAGLLALLMPWRTCNVLHLVKTYVYLGSLYGLVDAVRLDLPPCCVVQQERHEAPQGARA
jgi:hypothetical protein